MSNTKGQTTLFVILGIAIIAVVAGFVFFMPQITKMTMSEEQAKKVIAAEKGNVENYIKDCVRTSVIKNLIILGRQGGRIVPEGEHFTIPPGFLNPFPLDYAYYYDKNEKKSFNKLPSTSEMKEELMNNIIADDVLMQCLELKSFQKKFFIDTGALEIDIENMDIGEASGKTVVPFKYPVTLTLGDVKTTMEDYSAAIPLNLFTIREAAGKIINALSTGEPITKVQVDYATLQTIDLRGNSNGERLYINSLTYDLIPSDDNTYNSKNNFVTITYENVGLDSPYIFNFVIGSE